MRGAMSNKVILKDENQDHKYFCILQNILSYIGLNAFERSLYWALKEACGGTGVCTKSHETLCQMSGMGLTKLKETIKSLALINVLLGKPLIIVTARFKESGDKAPNEITLVDLWVDNISHFQKNIGQSPRDQGQSPRDQGQSPRDGGVSRHATINKIPYKKIKTTTTNKSKSSSSFSQEVEVAAQRAFDFVKVRAEKQPDEKWNIDLLTLKKHFHLFGIDYTADQFKYLIERMDKYNKNKSKVGNKLEEVSDPKVYFKRSCSENWAKSLHTKEYE